MGTLKFRGVFENSGGFYGECEGRSVAYGRGEREGRLVVCGSYKLK